MDAARHVLELCTPTRPRDTHSAISALIAITQKSKIKFKLCLSFTRHSPRYLSDLLTLAADVAGRPSFRTFKCGDFMVPRTNRKFGNIAFSMAAAQAWNRLRYQLPTELRQLRSTPAAFKLSLKTFWFTAVWASEMNYDLCNASSVYCRRLILRDSLLAFLIHSPASRFSRDQAKWLIQTN